MSVCLIGGHKGEPAETKNGWTDQDAVWGRGLSRVGPRNHVLDVGWDPFVGSGNFFGLSDPFKSIGSLFCGVGRGRDHSVVSNCTICMQCGLSSEFFDHLFIAVTTCPALEVSNGNVSTTAALYGTEATIECHDGYVAQQQMITCNETGQWLPAVDVFCKRITYLLRCLIHRVKWRHSNLRPR